MSPSVATIVAKKKRRRILFVSVVVIIISWISLVRTQCGREPQMDDGPFLAQGEVVAEEAIKALGDKGSIVILTMEMGGSVADTTKLQLDSFLKTLKKRSTISVRAHEHFQPPPYVDSDIAPPVQGVTGEFLLQLIQKHPDARAIVSFAGSPILKDEQIRALGEGTPKIIVASNATGSPRDALKRLFDANLVLFAVTHRTTAPPAGKPKTSRDVFDRFYQIVTPETAGELSASS